MLRGILESADGVLSDEELEWLRALPKHKVSAKRPKPKGQYIERQFECISDEHELLRYRLFMCWNSTFPTVSFSTGLQVILPGRRDLVLCRYNGPGHLHTNRIERQKVHGTCHIHRATHRYLSQGLDAEGFAEATDRYVDVDGALRCLVTDCSIAGVLPAQQQGDEDTLDLFGGTR